MTWHAPLHTITARGEDVVNVGGLAGLAAARRAHAGQFFTPPAVVDLVWRLLGAATAPRAVSWGHRRCRIIDTAAGSGRLLWPADPERHELWAIECDPECVGPLAEAHAAARFVGAVHHGRMEECRIDGFDLAILNPPFSLHWDGPTIEPLAVNAAGRYGAHSSAISHWYALAQAHAAAAVVAAIVPAAVADALQTSTEPGHADLRAALRAVVYLPPTAFRAAGAEVETAIVVLADAGSVIDPTPRVTRCRTLDPMGIIPLDWMHVPASRNARAEIADAGLQVSQPAITQPVTGDWRVRIAHTGRRIVLGFHCGAAEAIVRNDLLVRLLQRPERPQTPRPRGVRYDGQGVLDLEVHLAQPDPAASVAALADRIRRLGMTVEVDNGLLRHLDRRARRYAREAIPVRRTIWRPEGGDPSAWLLGQSTARAEAITALSVGGATLAAGTQVTLTRGEDPGQAEPRWHLATAGGTASLPHRLVLRAFRLPDAPTGGWQLAHPGLRVHAPVAWQAAKRDADRCGLTRFLTRSYQYEDCIELHARQRGICGWHMGLGKARLAIALALLGGRRNLVVVEARLIAEMRREIAAVGLPDDQWQEITCPAHTRRLRRINLVSYSRLKMPLGGYGATTDPADATKPAGERRVLIRESRDTIASRLRHRIHTLVADEAHGLKNGTSDQSRACLRISPRRAFDLSGTPIANYPRDILPLLRHVGGDGTVSQPYGQHYARLQPWHVRSMDRAERGNEAFASMFCTVEWVTNEWLDDPQNGAKREIPKIKDIPAFRSLVAPAVVRRVPQEPEVAAYMRIPTPEFITTTVAWHDDHLDHYIDVAERFAQWHAEYLKKQGKLKPNLAVLLAKIGAVVAANNNPQDHRGDSPFRYRGGWTAKQSATLDRCEELAAAGHKTIVFMHAPGMVELLAAELRRRGLANVRMHGGIPIAQRIAALDADFRQGDAPVLLATYGVCQQGLNIHQADRVILYDRDWTAAAEFQAVARVLRPQQIRPVIVERFHHAGSIDVYQDQMVDYKGTAMAAGLDYGEDNGDGEFLHYETILSRFVDSIGGLRTRRAACHAA
jgi:hypothetical protein